MNLLTKYLKRITEEEDKYYTSKESVDKIDNIITSPLTVDEKELFEERAAIMEYDGGLSRKEAESESVKLIATLSLKGGHA